MSLLGYIDFASEAIADVASRQTVSWRPITEEEDFPRFPGAWRVCQDESSAQVWKCSRRSFKTGTAIRRTVKRSSERAGWRTLYIHRTRALAKQQFFETGETVGEYPNRGIRELLRHHNIPELRHDLTELWVRLHNGSLIQAIGCDNIRDVDKKLGFQWNDIILEECQDWDDDILQRLVKKTIIPTLFDRGGSMTLMGTPAQVEFGFWYELYTDSPFTKHEWTLLDNPFITREEVVSKYRLAGLLVDFENPRNNDPLVQREVFGLHAIDKSALLYAYEPGRNDWDDGKPPDTTTGPWSFAYGLDIGGANEGNDRDADAVLGWRRDDPEHRLYEIASWEARQLDSEQLAAIASRNYGAWKPMVAACGDTGGAGANKAMATISKRVGGIHWTPKPTSVELSMRLLNDELRSGRLKVNPKGLIARDCRLCTKNGKYHSDVMAALRYAQHCATNFMAKPPPPPETDDERRVRQWLERRAAMEDPYNPFRI